MKERPIIFSTEMVRTIIGGHKTQTRRVIKPQPFAVFHVKSTVKRETTESLAAMADILYREEAPKSCPFGQPGDRLWVRETFGVQLEPGIFEDYPNGYVIYKADLPDGATFDYEGGGSAWRPSIHMPRWASRTVLEIINIKVGRVQEISEADAQREGWFFQNMDVNQTYDPVIMDYAHRWFIDLWDNLNAKRGFPWESNPWVWIIEFKMLEISNNA
jgi:hypothetical protein